MNIEQVLEYVNGDYEWDIKGNGPKKYNCWNLQRHIQRTYFDRELCEVDIEDEDLLRQMFVENVRGKIWEPVYPPRHGDGVLLKGGSDPHVGVFLDIDGGMVLHIMQGFGMLATPVRNLRGLGFGRVIYYRINKEPSDGNPAAD